jgi:phage terminase large subunit-like protein
VQPSILTAAPRRTALVEQITMFPSAAHNDMADMMSQAAAWLLQRPCTQFG